MAELFMDVGLPAPRGLPAAMAPMVLRHTRDHEDWEEFSRMKLAEGGSIRRYYPLDAEGQAEYEA